MMGHRIGAALAMSMLTVFTACTGEHLEVSRSDLRESMIRGWDGRTGEYDVVENWWKAAPNHLGTWTWGQVAGVAVDTPDRIIAVTRGDSDGQGNVRARATNFIVVADRDGNIIEQWTQWDSILTLPHQVYINPYDPERHVWVVDSGGSAHHQVLKFSNDGSQLVMRLGDRDNPRTREEARANSSPGPYTLGWPSTLAFLPNGDFLLADGYWNSRVVRYTTDGEYIREWGELGTGPGQFDLLHGTAVGGSGRVYVGDRTNNRIQVFAEDGSFIEEWPDIRDPVGVWVDKNESVWVVSADLNHIVRYSRDGVFQYRFGSRIGRGWEGWEGALDRPHQIDVDEEGALYIASYDGGWVNKLVPKPGADRINLIGSALLLTE